jgi:hypothetical protein
VTCNVVVTCPLSRMTVREAFEALGQEGGKLPIDDSDKPRGMSAKQWLSEVKPRRQRERDAENASFIDPITMFVCGDFKIEACACGHTADFLCDYPMGRGKTCDLALCGCCRESIGEERDLCRVHAAQFRGAAVVVPKFTKPKLVKP